jgi:hypothetical protein
MYNQEKDPSNFSFIDQNTIYQIRVKGKITSSLINIVDDMQIRQESEADTLSLIGWLPDQSALLGLLNGLDEIHYEILSVNLLPIMRS